MATGMKRHGEAVLMRGPRLSLIHAGQFRTGVIGSQDLARLPACERLALRPPLTEAQTMAEPPAAIEYEMLVQRSQLEVRALDPVSTDRQSELFGQHVVGFII